MEESENTRRQLGGLPGYFNSFGTYFFLIILSVFFVTSLIYKSFFMVGLLGITIFLTYYFFVRRGLRHKLIEFNSRYIYINKSSKVPLADIEKVGNGRIVYKEGKNRKIVYFTYVPYDKNLRILKELLLARNAR